MGKIYYETIKIETICKMVVKIWCECDNQYEYEYRWFNENGSISNLKKTKKEEKLQIFNWWCRGKHSFNIVSMVVISLFTKLAFCAVGLCVYINRVKPLL